MQHTDAREVVKNTIRYCEEILSSKKRFTRKLQDEIRNNVIYHFWVEQEGEEFFLTFQNREYMELGMDCNHRKWIHEYTRYRINGPLPKDCSIANHEAGYLYGGCQPYYDRKAMREYVDCLYELLDLLNSL